MRGSNFALFLCSTLILSTTAFPMFQAISSQLNNIGQRTGNDPQHGNHSFPMPATTTVKPVDDLNGNLVRDLTILLRSAPGLLNNILKHLIQVLDQLATTLKIPGGQDPVKFVQNLVNELEPIVEQTRSVSGQVSVCYV